MTTFQEARSFLLKHRTDYDAAVKGFRWPDPVPFNWALDWFDAELARNADSKDRPALWIVDAGSNRETKLSFEALSRRSNQVANFLRAQGLKRGDHLLLLLGNVVPLWETMLAAMKLGRRGDSRHHAADAGRIARPARSRPRQGGGGVAGPGREIRRPRRRQLIRIVVNASSKQDGWLAFEQAAEFPEEFTPDGPTGPTIRCCCISPRAPPQSRNWCGTASAAIPSAHCRRCTGSGLQPGDVHLNISSPGWAKHAWSCFFAPWNAGATVFVVNQPRFDAKGLLATIGRCGVTTLCAPPTVWRLFIQEKLADFKFRLREVCGAGEPLNPEVIDQVRNAWGLTIRDGYGQTETTALAGNSPGQEVKVGSMGRPLPGYRVQITDIDGHVTKEGEVTPAARRRPPGRPDAGLSGR